MRLQRDTERSESERERIAVFYRALKERRRKASSRFAASAGFQTHFPSLTNVREGLRLETYCFPLFAARTAARQFIVRAPSAGSAAFFAGCTRCFNCVTDWREYFGYDVPASSPFDDCMIKIHPSLCRRKAAAPVAITHTRTSSLGSFLSLGLTSVPLLRTFYYLDIVFFCVWLLLRMAFFFRLLHEKTSTTRKLNCAFSLWVYDKLFFTHKQQCA